MNTRILLVDDEQNILDTFRRTLYNKLPVDTAMGSAEGLEKILKNEPYAVVISDYAMPGMNGIQFLAKVRESAPDTVRIILTGNADLNMAMDAVNQDQIFRFLLKPCPQEVLLKALHAGIQQYDLITSQRELLEKTLHGAVKTLIDILSTVNPVAFGRASRIRKNIKLLAEKLNLPNPWQIEIAAMLSQIGFITIPPKLLEKIYRQEELTENELKLYADYPATSKRLIENIPRLEEVARIIELHQKPFRSFENMSEQNAKEKYYSLAAQIIKTVSGYDDLTARGAAKATAVNWLLNKPLEYNPKVVEMLKMLPDEGQEVYMMVHVHELTGNMITLQDIYTESGILLMSKGQEITATLVERLKNIDEEAKILQPIKIKFAGLMD